MHSSVAVLAGDAGTEGVAALSLWGLNNPPALWVAGTATRSTNHSSVCDVTSFIFLDAKVKVREETFGGGLVPGHATDAKAVWTIQ